MSTGAKSLSAWRGVKLNLLSSHSIGHDRAARAQWLLRADSGIPSGLMLNFSVELGAKKHNGVRNPQPDHYADSGAERPISRVVICKAGEIPREEERRDDPRHRSEYAADSHPLPTR